MIAEHLLKLHELAEQTSKIDVSCFAIYRRFTAIGILSYMNEVIQELEMLNAKLDIDIELEAVEINYDLFLDPHYWYKLELFSSNDVTYRIFDVKGYYYVEDPKTDVNQLTDFLPNEDERVSYTQDQKATFKTCMIQLCDDDRLNEKVLKYALHKALRIITGLLTEIKKKIRNPKDIHFVRLWEEIVRIYASEDWETEYANWKDEYDEITFDRLKEKQMQEIVSFLKTPFLRFRPNPTRGDLKRCKIVIPDEAFDNGYEMPANLDVQCARFDGFISWADEGENIMVLDKKRLGKYLFRHNNQLTDDEKEAIVRLDVMLDYIHEDMAMLDISLKSHLKRYEENMVNSLIVDCSAILNSCQKHLRDDMRTTFLREYLSMMLFDKDMKQEAREKLSSAKSRNKYLCHMIAAMHYFNVFKADVVKEDLARSLYPQFKNKQNFDTTLENIERFQRKLEGPLYNWTKNNIDDLKEHPYNPFKGLL